MKIKILFFFLFSILFSPNIIYAVNTPDSNSKAAQLIQNLPVQFIENKGQMVDMEGKPVPSVLYKAEVAGLNLYITEKGLTYVFIKSEQTKQEKMYLGLMITFITLFVILAVIMTIYFLKKKWKK